MKRPRLSSWFCLLAALALSAGASAQEKAGWEPKEIAGESYLPVDQISRFYRLEDPKRDGKEVTLENKKVLAVFEVGSYAFKINGIKFVFYKPVKEADAVAHVSQEDLSLILDPVLRPSYIKDAGEFRTVILDPAHGGKDQGAVSDLGTAAGYSLAVARLVEKQLEARGYKVVLTRKEDVDRSLQKRLEIANAVKDNSVFVSIDFGSGPKDKRGIETRTLAHADRGAVKKGVIDFGSSSLALATGVHGYGIMRLKEDTVDLGVRRARYAVFSKIQCPAIEIKGGYLTHEAESRMIHTDAYQSALASGIARGIEKYRLAVRRKP